MVKLLFERLLREKPYHTWAFLDPNNHWAVIEATIETASTKSWQSVTYNSEVKGVAFPKCTLYTIVWPKDGASESYEATYDVPHECKAPAQDFKLAAYGFPEIPQASRWAHEWHWSSRDLFEVVSVLTLLCLVALVVWRRWRRLPK